MAGSALNYDSLAREYGAHRTPNQDVLEALSELAGRHSSPDLLEVGMGTGNYATALMNLGVGSVVGIDSSREMLLQVRDPMRSRMGQARAERLPFPDRSFSMVYSVDVIHHIRDRDGGAAEAHRVLAPGGIYVIVTDSEDDLPRRVPLARYFPETVEAERKRYPPIGKLRAEIARAGFTDFTELHTLTRWELTDIQPYRDKAFSSLHLITSEAFARGIARLESDLQQGPIPGESPYTLLVSRRPPD